MMLVKLDNRGGKGRNWFVAVWTCFGGLFWFYNDFGYSGFFTHWVLRGYYTQMGKCMVE